MIPCASFSRPTHRRCGRPGDQCVLRRGPWPALIALAWLAGTAGGGRGQTADRLRTVADSVRVELGAPGAIVGVLRGDADPVVVAVGLADRDRNRPMSPNDPFYLGSVTKTWTAVAILELAEEGLLGLDDPLSRWVSDVPRGDEITLRHLLRHTSGLRDFFAWFYYRPDRDRMIDLVTRTWTRDELIELAGRFGHAFDPGTDWAYSSAGYTLLGIVAERAAGAPLTEVFRTRIVAPLGLETVWVQGWEEEHGTLPVGYMGPVDGWEHSAMFGELGPTTPLDRGNSEWAAGGLVATAPDALRFFDAVMEGRLISATSLRALRAFQDTPPLGVPDPEVAAGEREDGYGLGLVRMTVAGRVLEGHGGLYNGHTTGLWRVRGCDLTLVTYVNRGFVGQRPMLTALIRALLPGGSCAEA